MGAEPFRITDVADNGLRIEVAEACNVVAVALPIDHILLVPRRVHEADIRPAKRTSVPLST